MLLLAMCRADTRARRGVLNRDNEAARRRDKKIPKRRARARARQRRDPRRVGYNGERGRGAAGELALSLTSQTCANAAYLQLSRPQRRSREPSLSFFLALPLSLSDDVNIDFLGLRGLFAGAFLLRSCFFFRVCAGGAENADVFVFSDIGVTLWLGGCLVCKMFAGAGARLLMNFKKEVWPFVVDE